MKRTALPRMGVAALLLGAALIGLPSIAGATCPGVCTPTYDSFSGILVGCCNADCTWKTGSLAQTKCTNPSNPCQQLHCTADTHTCSSGTATTTGGHPACVSATDECKIGECFSQVCTYVDNNASNGFDDRCDDNRDCTNDVCTKDGGGHFVSCSNPDLTGTPCNDPASPFGVCEVGQCTAGTCYPVAAPPGNDCSTTSGSTCTPKQCDVNGVCQPNGTPVTCNGNPGVCKVWSCSFSGGSPVCSAVKAAIGTNCDIDGHDCKNQTCLSTGKCGNQAAPVNAVCDPNYTQPELTDCETGVCNSRKDCVGIAGTSAYDNMECSDGKTCTIAKCSGGVCAAPATCHGAERTCPGCPGVACDSGQAVPTCNCAN